MRLTDSVDWATERHEAECVVEDASSVEERGGEAEELFTLHLHPPEEATLGETLLGEHIVLTERENGDEGRSGNRISLFAGILQVLNDVCLNSLTTADRQRIHDRWTLETTQPLFSLPVDN